MAGMTMSTLKIVNNFHNFEKSTKSREYATVLRIVRASKPSDCKSVTRIYEMDGRGDSIGIGYLDQNTKTIRFESH